MKNNKKEAVPERKAQEQFAIKSSSVNIVGKLSLFLCPDLH